MKKSRKFLFLSLIVFLINISWAFASESSEKRYVTFDAGIATAIPLYGDSHIKAQNSKIKENGIEFVVGTVVDVNAYLNQYWTIFAGCDFLFDACLATKKVSDISYFNHLDLAVFPGIKFYPGFGGLNISCAFATGYRFDLISENEGEEPFLPCSVGNGFRLAVEYNFSYGTEYYWPSVGIYYRLMSRGSYKYDNVFGAYLSFNF